MDIKDVKEANPIELTVYSVANKIDDEPNFAWWLNCVFNKRDKIIPKAKTRH